GLDTTQPLSTPAADCARQRAPRFGTAHPDEMNNSFRDEMVRTRWNAWQARTQSGYAEACDGPVWCFQRFGQSLTQLPAGEFVEIGGEHEDFYDPDFCIYNDVVVHDGQGQFRILGYPPDVFPPTDFHSATFVDGSIYIIGCLGYPDDRRPGETPVFRLNCETWCIEPVESREQLPGWIHSHQAQLCEDGTILVRGGRIWNGQADVASQQDFRFDPRTGCWSVDNQQTGGTGIEERRLHHRGQQRDNI
ncbi:MAG: hypothetical protein VB858_16990, partial [Planctomycetaceae bacterium]